MKKWKLATIAGTLLISFTVGGMAVLADTNVVTEQDGVKVFVGAVSQTMRLQEVLLSMSEQN